MRNLIVILGDQLDLQSPGLKRCHPKHDHIWMAEVYHESVKVKSHKVRIALFLSAMRHFKNDLQKNGYQVHYQELDDPKAKVTFKDSLLSFVEDHQPQKIILLEPGEYCVRADFLEFQKQSDIEVEFVEDTHFLVSHAEFAAHSKGRKQLRMEYFYRELRKKHNILMEDDQPIGEKWNYDSENRKSFKKNGPELTKWKQFKPDSITKEVLKLVENRFADHPGKLENFDWPVTRKEALQALKYFIKNHLPDFGTYQDAMWQDRPYLYHSRLSASLNIKLLNPREVIKAAEDAYHQGHAPLHAVEGFIRQILGWREYVRGIYWLKMPDYLELNELNAEQPLPGFYWDASTEMNCLQQCISQTLEYGYAHHIQRLMVTGLFSLLLGVKPKAIHQWYLAIYLDAVEWVELPNTLGMSQFADGGMLGSKPYIATGKYINKMSNYCKNCRYDYAKATGENACPFTTLYWDFLDRHQTSLKKNTRMRLQLNNLKKKTNQEIQKIKAKAQQIISTFNESEHSR